MNGKREETNLLVVFIVLAVLTAVILLVFRPDIVEVVGPYIFLKE